MKPRGAEPHRKTTPGRHLLYVFIGWGFFLCFLSVLAPPLDSRVEPPPLVLWSIIAITALLTPYTAVAVPAYLYQSWLKLPTVPNRTAYGLWIGLESLLLLATEFGAIYLLLYMLYGMRFR
jgi:hypothetical protein